MATPARGRGHHLPVPSRDAAERIYMATLRRRETLAFPASSMRVIAKADGGAFATGYARGHEPDRRIRTRSTAMKPPASRSARPRPEFAPARRPPRVPRYYDGHGDDLRGDHGDGDAVRRGRVARSRCRPRGLARHLVENGSHGLVVGGHDRRVADALRRREARACCERSLDEVGDRATVIAGPGRTTPVTRPS